MLKKMMAVLALALISTTTLALEIGDQAPCMNLDQIKVDGSRINHSICDRNANTKFVILDFFQTNCSSCLVNLPLFTKLSVDTQTTTTARLIALDRNEQDVVGFVAMNTELIKYEVPLDSKRQATRAYGIEYTPTTFVLDQNNKVVFKHVGVFSTEDQIQLRKLLEVK